MPLSLVPLAFLIAGQAAPAAPSPDKAAETFRLDLAAPADDRPANPAPIVAAAPASDAAFSLDTPIGRLIADPRTKKVLDANLPGLSDDENLAKFSDMSLRQFQPMTGGQLTPELLAKVGEELAAIDGATPAPASPVKHRRNRATSR